MVVVLLHASSYGGSLPEHTVVAAVHADRMRVFLLLRFVTLFWANTSHLVLFVMFLCMSIDVSIDKSNNFIYKL